MTTLVNVANSTKNQTLTFFEGLTSSDVLIFIFKVNLIVLYKAVYLSRSIRLNKYPKIKFQIWRKAKLSPSLPFLILRGKFKRRNVVTQGVLIFPYDIVKIANYSSMSLLSITILVSIIEKSFYQFQYQYGLFCLSISSYQFIEQLWCTYPCETLIRKCFYRCKCMGLLSPWKYFPH